ncbi:MAG: hypothetical protein ACC742_09715 [Thermoanaerobaculales bacterium]
MRRILSGSLKHLAPPALLRLVSATSPSGILELVTDAGSLRLEVNHGLIGMPSEADLRHAGEVLECCDGAFRFEPCEVPPLEDGGLSLADLADVAVAGRRQSASHSGREAEADRAMGGEVMEVSRPASRTNIHVLPTAPLQNPLDDLLVDLEAEAPEELLFAQVGVVAQDPRVWRGSIDRQWRRRGWEVRLFGALDEMALDGLDVLVVHHQLATTRVGAENDWLALIQRAEELTPPVPVIWVASLGDPVWVHRLIETGVAFMIPAPQGESGETMARFIDALTLVVDRQLLAVRQIGRPELPSAVSELVDALLHEAEPEQAVGALLQLAAVQLTRGSVLMVEETAIRCRAGFGYPLDRDATALPRGVGLLERVIISGDASMEIDPEAGGARHLAGVLGITELPAATAVIPLGGGGSAAGLLVADNGGEPLPDLAELVLLAARLGGVAVRPN